MPAHRAGTPQADTRRLAAILFPDLVGFSRQLGSAEARRLRPLEGYFAALRQAGLKEGYTISEESQLPSFTGG